MGVVDLSLSTDHTIKTERPVGLLDRNLAERLANEYLYPDHRFSLEEHGQSGRNRLYRCRGENGRDWLLKQPGGQTGRQSPELFFYRSIGPADGIAPGCRYLGNGVLAIEYLTDAMTLHDYGVDRPYRMFTKLVELTAAVAEIHAMVGKAGVPAASMTLIALAPVDIDLWIRTPDAGREVIRSLQRRPSLQAAYNRARAAGGPAGLIHCDLKPDNIMVSDQQQTRVIDWELCGLGPVAADVGALLGTIVLRWIDGFAIDTETDMADWIDRGSVRVDAMQAALGGIVDAYRTAAQSHSIDVPTRVDLVDHTAAWIVARTWAEATIQTGPSIRRWVRLSLAEQMVTSPDRFLPR